MSSAVATWSYNVAVTVNRVKTDGSVTDSTQIDATQSDLITAGANGNIVLRANTDGSSVRLRDVARIEVAGQAYVSASRLNGMPATGLGIQLSPTGNALAAATGVRERMAELKAA